MDLERLIESWRAAKLPLRAGATDAELAATEARLGVTLPAAVQQFYRRIDGFERNTLEPRTHIRLWPLAELEAAEVGVQFADFLIESHRYAVDPAGRIVIVGYRVVDVVADSFDEFLDHVASDSPRLFGRPQA